MAEFEASLNGNGIPIDEATSKEADPSNPRGTYRYEAVEVIDWSEVAAVEMRKSHGRDDPYSGARVLRVRRVDRQPRR